MKKTRYLEKINHPKETEALRASDVLGEIIKKTEEHFKREIKLNHDRVLRVDLDKISGDRITLCNQGGKIELQITITEKGPVLHFQTADLKIQSKGIILLECEDFQVHAHHEIKQISEGDFHQQVGGNASIDVRGDFQTKARICSFNATRGNIDLHANDDIKMKSERILLNC